VTGLIQDGKLTPVVDRTYPLPILSALFRRRTGRAAQCSSQCSGISADFRSATSASLSLE
jgi:hypothetical protein